LVFFLPADGAGAGGKVIQVSCVYRMQTLARNVDSSSVKAARYSDAVPLSHSDPLRSTREAIQLAKVFGPSFGMLENNPSGNSVELRRKARDIASDTVDEMFFHHKVDGGDLKMHLSTGEILISDSAGKVSVVAQLDVDERPLGDFKNPGEIFDFLVGYVFVGDPKKKMHHERRLAVGKNLEVTGFTSAVSAQEHYEKHVRRSREFEVADTAGYEAAAVAFANSTAGNSVSVTQRSSKNVNGMPAQALTVKVNALTGELVWVNRDTGKIITYYRYDPRRAAGHLSRLGLDPPGNIIEYALAMAHAE
jgi:hypothetical protein